MKKLCSMLMLLTVMFTIVACGNENGGHAEQTNTNSMEESRGDETVKHAFDFEKKTVTLNSGYEMPLNGLGTYSLEGETCVSSVSEALKRGVRLIDTAYMYHNDVICCEV